MQPHPDVNVHRIYDERDGGCRVLVDRLWPRGMTKADAALDEWLRDVAPSTELRRWYGHDVTRFEEFARRYRAELRRPPASKAVQLLIELAQSTTLTLLTATRDVEHSGARVLHGLLTSRASRSRRRSPPGVTVDAVGSHHDRVCCRVPPVATSSRAETA
ncbi:MAG TPA: DUF488 family protein [Acidimicrobiales bacterium]|nr:DUF488 family protein [Acidimicrobiales bacterium]